MSVEVGVPAVTEPPESGSVSSFDADRRTHPRYSPDPWLPVVFASRRVEEECAGHIVDISEGGLRLVAPPFCACPLVWGDLFDLTLSYSESTRRFGLEGLVLEAVVVRVVSDARAYVVHAMFRNRALHDRLRSYLEAFARQADLAEEACATEEAERPPLPSDPPDDR